MANDGSVVNYSSYFFSQLDANALGFAACGAPAVHDGIIRIRKNLCGFVNRFVDGDWNELAVLANQRSLNSVFAIVT
jgi:hypothetical protein